jgi:hypothetical protein
MDGILAQGQKISYSEEDMRRLCEGKVKVVPYSHAKNAHNLSEVLGSHRAAIVLYETEPSYGHWCALFEVSPNMLEFFDPYGARPDSQLSMVPAGFRGQSGQDYPYLSDLIKDSAYKNVIYNDVKLQKTSPGTSTCGRWCALRVCFRNVPLKQFQRWFLHQKLAPDQYVTALTMFNK